MYTIAISVITLFILIFAGFILGKTGVVNKEATPDFSNLLIKVTIPATVFLSIIGQDGDNLMASVGSVFAIAIVVHAIAGLVGLLLVHVLPLDSQEKGVWIYTCMLSNNGFMGLPLALSVYGSYGMFLMACTNIITNMLIFSLGVKLLTDHYQIDEKISVRKMFVNPCNMAVLAGFLVQIFGIPVHEVLTSSIGYVGAITSGLSMLVVGFSLSRLPVKEVAANKKMLILAAAKLFLVPLITIVLLKLIPFITDATMIGVSIMSAALPASSAQSMLTEQYGTNTKAAGQAVFITTLLSVVTVPLMMMLMQIM